MVCYASIRRHRAAEGVGELVRRTIVAAGVRSIDQGVTSMQRRRFISLGASAGLGAILPLASPAVVRAQPSWPERPVKLIVPFPPGAGTDLVGRPWAEMLGQHFGQQFVLEHRSGASGVIGTEAAAKAVPDGYTFLVASATSVVTVPLLRPVPYDHAAIRAVGRLGDVVCGFVINSAVGPMTFQETVDYAKRNPDKLAFGSGGPGTIPHMRLEMLKHKTGIRILHVPYRGAGEATPDIIANVVQMGNDPGLLPHVKTGRLHLIAVNHGERMPEFPASPTLAELGYPGSDMPTWFCLWAPAGTPDPIVRRLNAAIVQIARTEAMKEKLKLASAVPVPSTIEETEQFRAAETKSIAELIRIASIKFE